MTKQQTIIEEREHRYALVTIKLQSFPTSVESLWADLKKEVDNYRSGKYEPAERGARITAAIKRYKTRKMLHFIVKDVLCNHIGQFDMTPLTIRKLSKALFDGRSGSQEILVELFGFKGRTRKASNFTHELIGELAKTHGEAAKSFMTITNIGIEQMKDRYRLEKSI